ncbi:WcaF family extracellular polysaccharide biosynthesis acetyltransferase [Trichothermofontia sichuanensis B231]|uniref:WcaF family extracellular polysaccharide biosynthesis acetyltransferase n=1 Tax=Trichothermofontia sichuanensis TaxID=3045816 RepID=UPI00224734D1|nr:WcaF family extracellular polysaccharide biosynthesis acetyltransferase [Trichothermofontia sichuanensis B231]
MQPDSLAPVVGVQLDRYQASDYTPGAPLWQQLAWYFIGTALVESRLIPFSGFKVWVLRRFGARIGHHVRIKPGVRIKFPWRLLVGNHVWIGENAWLDNLAPITLADQVCLSQGVYLCTGNHDWSDPTFALKTGPIHVETGAWIAAKAIVGPGVTIGAGAVLTMGSVTGRSLAPMMIYAGNPAQPIKTRSIEPTPLT